MKDKKVVTIGQLKYRKSETKAIDEAIIRYETRLNIRLSEAEKVKLREELRNELRESHSRRTKAGIEHRKKMKD